MKKILENKLEFDENFIIDKRPFRKEKRFKYSDIKEYSIKVSTFSPILYSHSGLSKYLVIKTNIGKKYKVLIDNDTFLKLSILNDDQKILELLKIRCPNAKYIENKSFLNRLLK